MEVPIDSSVLVGGRKIILNNLSEQFNCISDIEMAFPHEKLQKTISEYRNSVLRKFCSFIYQEDPSYYSKGFGILGIVVKARPPRINREYGKHCG